MKTIDLLQNSEEWDKLRASRLGASDANIIMGMSKFMTPAELFAQKAGQSKKQTDSNFIQEKGHRKEVKARARFEFLTGYEWPPVVCLHSEYDFLMASLDGYNEELNENWECKFVGKDDFAQVKSGKMLDKYFPQVQMQMAVTGARCCNFTVINEDDEIHTIQVAVDIDYVQIKLYPALFEFWGKVQNNEKPELTDKDTVDLSPDEQLEKLLNEYEVVKSQLDLYDENANLLKEEIFKICKHPKNICGKFKVTISKSKDSEVVDYDKMVKELNIDTSGFMKVKKGITRKLISF